ncbi:hypothetical protein AB0I84_31815 [Streptomyces spectabilis]|uniref:hypothetical protein n=1 Tax=Streptomyces spectabilis TaxID=68270 RepID=UPI0033BFEC4C
MALDLVASASNTHDIKALKRLAPGMPLASVSAAPENGDTDGVSNLTQFEPFV